MLVCVIYYCIIYSHSNTADKFTNIRKHLCAWQYNQIACDEHVGQLFSNTNYHEIFQKSKDNTALAIFCICQSNVACDEHDDDLSWMGLQKAKYKLYVAIDWFSRLLSNIPS